MFDLRLQVYDLYEAAQGAYNGGQFRRAAELYRRMMELAESAGGRDELFSWYAVVARRALAESFRSNEQLREALTTLTPLAVAGREPIRSCCAYGTLIDKIEYAVEAPVSLQTIERAFAEAEDYLRASAPSTWRSLVLHMRAELFRARGMFREALRAAQEAWVRWKDECPKFYSTSHLKSLVEIGLALGDFEQARTYLSQWERFGDNKSITRESVRCELQSRLARIEGRFGEAVDHARRAVQITDPIDSCAPRHAAGRALVRALLLAGEHERARNTLVRLSPARRSESGHEHYAFQLLRGDYHLSLSRKAAGAGCSDDEFGTSFTLREKIDGGLLLRRELRKARAAYAVALRIGTWVDEQLRCALRQREVYARLSRVSDIERLCDRG
ncbi:MAG: hypothetical protein M3362_04925 [Acidobacteriota bacterium]|nr:hypothetical protein [Acidobacteriota bacterium]